MPQPLVEEQRHLQRLRNRRRASHRLARAHLGAGIDGEFRDSDVQLIGLDAEPVGDVDDLVVADDLAEAHEGGYGVYLMRRLTDSFSIDTSNPPGTELTMGKRFSSGNGAGGGE